MKNFLFINLWDESLGDELLDIIPQYRSIHLNLINHSKESSEYYEKLFATIKKHINPEEDVFVYCHNIESVNAAKDNGFFVHYCFLNDSLSEHNDFFKSMKKDLNAEVFWILDDRILNYPLDSCM